jgi:hypothetical protein
MPLSSYGSCCVLTLPKLSPCCMQGLLLGVGGKQLQRIKQESNSRVEVVNSHGNLNGSHPDPIDETLHALVTADNMVGAVLRWAGRSWAMLDWAAVGHAGLGLGRAVLFWGIGMVVALGRVLGWSWLGRAGLCIYPALPKRCYVLSRCAAVTGPVLCCAGLQRGGLSTHISCSRPVLRHACSAWAASCTFLHAHRMQIAAAGEAAEGS